MNCDFCRIVLFTHQRRLTNINARVSADVNWDEDEKAFFLLLKSPHKARNKAISIKVVLIGFCETIHNINWHDEDVINETSFRNLRIKKLW